MVGLILIILSSIKEILERNSWKVRSVKLFYFFKMRGLSVAMRTVQTIDNLSSLRIIIDSL